MTSDDGDLTPLDPTGAVLSDAVYSALGAAITDGRLRPGERLRDGELARRLGVSRTPVREALQRLERSGLVEVSAGRWTRVTTPNEQTVAATHEFAVYMMGNATRMTVTRCSDEVLHALLHDIDAMAAASAADDLPALYEARVDFFSAVTMTCGNIALQLVIQESEFLLRRNLGGREPNVSDPAVRNRMYAALRDAVVTRDADAAEHAVRRLHGIG